MAPNTDEADDKLVPKPAVLVGLHACGDLSNSTLKLFVSNPKIQGLSLVSCCYHKMIKFPLSTVYKQRIFADRHTDGSESFNAADRLSCLKSPHALRLASQEPFTRYLWYISIPKVEKVNMLSCLNWKNKLSCYVQL